MKHNDCFPCHWYKNENNERLRCSWPDKHPQAKIAWGRPDDCHFYQREPGADHEVHLQEQAAEKIGQIREIVEK